MFVAFSVGKWIQEVSDELYEIVADRSQQPDYKHKISFCTDGNEQNENAIAKFFHTDSVNYGRVNKIRENQKVIGVHKENVFGYMSYDNISIAHVDGFCAALRERIKCAVRKSKTFVRKRKTIRELLAIYQAYHNLIDARQRATPCMKEGLVAEVWSWSKLLHTRLSYSN